MKLLLLLAGSADTPLLPRGWQWVPGWPGAEPHCLDVPISSGKTQGYGVGREHNLDRQRGAVVVAKYQFSKTFFLPWRRGGWQELGSCQVPVVPLVLPGSAGSPELCGDSLPLFITQFLHLLCWYLQVTIEACSGMTRFIAGFL